MDLSTSFFLSKKKSDLMTKRVHYASYYYVANTAIVRCVIQVGAAKTREVNLYNYKWNEFIHSQTP